MSQIKKNNTLSSLFRQRNYEVRYVFSFTIKVNTKRKKREKNLNYTTSFNSNFVTFTLKHQQRSLKLELKSSMNLSSFMQRKCFCGIVLERKNITKSTFSLKSVTSNQAIQSEFASIYYDYISQPKLALFIITKHKPCFNGLSFLLPN